MSPERKLYKSEILFTRTLPTQVRRELVLRTELDWDKDVESTSVTADEISTFQIQRIT